MKLFAAKDKTKVTYYDDKEKCFHTIKIHDVKFKPGERGDFRHTEIEGLTVQNDNQKVRYITSNLSLEQLYLREIGKSCQHVNLIHLNHACQCMSHGCTLLDLHSEIEKAPEYYQQKKEEEKRCRAQEEANKFPLGADGKPLPYFTGSKRILFEKEKGNEKAGTFDFIRVPYSVSSVMPRDELMAYIKRDFQVIAAHAVSRLENSARYQKFGVPVGFLRETGCILTNDRILQFTFELKETA